MEITLRNMKDDEAKAASEIALAAFATISGNGFSTEGKAAFANYASPNAIASRMKLGHEVILALVGSKIAGMAELRNNNHISMLFVLPEHIHNGIGTKLLSRVIAQAQKNNVKTKKVKQVTVHAADNSVSFYLKRNFRVSAARQQRDGISFTTMTFRVKPGDTVDRKIRRGEEVDFFVFSGTGNTYHAAKKISSLLEEKGVSVRCHKMEKNMNPVLKDGSVIGIAFPVACFSTYPIVLDFIKSLPEGNGRKIFMAATMGGAGMGMEGPIREILFNKGYSPIASKLFVMPGNYGNKSIPEEKNNIRMEKLTSDAVSFVEAMSEGAAKWKRGRLLLSKLMFRLCNTRMPWNMFYRMFPIQVNPKKCTVCGKCMRDCPACAIKLNNSSKFPQIDRKLCQSCQRCVGFCPQHAIDVPNNPAEQYACMSYDEFKNFGI